MKRFLLLWFFVFSALISSSQANGLLPADEAFVFKASVVNDKIELDWKIAQGYYLYKEKIKIVADFSEQLGTAKFPDAKIKNDEFFGKIGVYRNQATVSVPILKGDAKSIQLSVTYQGCADLGVCYPPITKSAILDVSASRPASVVDSALDMFSKVKQDARSVVDNIMPVSGEPLPVDEAFKFEAFAKNGSAITVLWNIHADYYLYHDKFFFEIQGADIDGIDIPKGKVKDDPLFGKTEIHKGTLSIDLPLKNISSQSVKLTAKYQGCWEGGVCYPPVEKNINVVLPIQESDFSSISENTADANNNGINSADLNEAEAKIFDLLNQGNVLWVIGTFFVIGLGLSLTPCVFPMIPILSGIIVGQKDVTHKKALIMSIVFVLAMSVTYAIAGVLAGYFGSNLQAALQTPWVLVMFSLIFVALAFSMFGFYEIQLPSGLQTKITNMSNKQEGGHLIGVAIMGFLSALIVGPCVAPPLAVALMYIGQTGDALLGGVSLFVMSLGMGVPLLIVGSGVSKLPRAGGWMDNVKYVFGVMMLGVAIYFMERILPELAVLALWALLLTVSPIALGVLNKLTDTSGVWARIFKALGLIVLGYGILLWGLVARGGGDMMAPLKGWGAGSHAEAVHIQFEQIKTTKDLDSFLDKSKQTGQIVMLDFYADWCIYCKGIEKNVFGNPEVVEKTKNMLALQVDITEMNANDKALIERLGVPNPPVILFFKNGVEVRSQRIVGDINAQGFLERFNKVQ